MASFSVDSNGERIKTDILISGYINDVTKAHQLEIPEEIIGLWFLFWFINVCDDWDQTLLDNQSFDINGSCAKLKTVGVSTLFGCQSVENGIFKWYMKFNTEINWACIGIIKDNQETIKKNKTNNNYGRDTGDGCFLFYCQGFGNGSLFCDGGIDLRYSDPSRDKGTILEITLNMNQHSIQYKVNDAEYAAKKINSFVNNRYRLAVTLGRIGEEIELL